MSSRFERPDLKVVQKADLVDVDEELPAGRFVSEVVVLHKVGGSVFEPDEDFIASMLDPIGFQKDIGGIHPMRRTGSPEDVARLICWLASEEADWVTGQVWTIDGGRMAQLSLP